MLLVDHQIRDLCNCANGKLPMIEPFSECVSEGVISYGLDHAGYCLRLAGEVLGLSTYFSDDIDPKKFKDSGYVQKLFDGRTYGVGLPVTIPPNGFILGRSVEYLRIPRNLKGRCVGKSTYARCGIVTNTTPLEPGWEGYLTIEISNTAPRHNTVYVGEGICQLEFEVLADEPQTSYADKKGIYQGQTGVTPARVRA